jgi:tRNA(Ile2) C34 agmatinyltransferase TiaS
MRKRKTKLSNVIMLLLILLVLFYLVFQQRSIKITAEELVANYSLNQENADKKFLNKDLEVTGVVKSYYEIENKNSILELKTENNETGLFCIIMNKEIEKKARSLASGTRITVYGKCLGANPAIAEKFFPGIYIETDRIK